MAAFLLPLLSSIQVLDPYYTGCDLTSVIPCRRITIGADSSANTAFIMAVQLTGGYFSSLYSLNTTFTLPDVFNRMPLLQGIRITGNKWPWDWDVLSWLLPQSLGACTHLALIDFSGNYHLKYRFPDSWLALRRVQWISIAGSSLTGCPWWISENATSIRGFFMPRAFRAVADASDYQVSCYSISVLSFCNIVFYHSRVL